MGDEMKIEGRMALFTGAFSQWICDTLSR